MNATSHTSPSARGLDGGRLLAGLGALVLLVSLFLDWYGSSDAFHDPDSSGISAWTSFELIDILLAALAVATIAWALEGILRSRRRLPDAIGSASGPVALVLVLVSIVNEPPVLFALDPDREAGIWLALAGAALMTIGALLRIARISLVVSPRDRTAPKPDPAAVQRTEEPVVPEAETRPLSQEPGLPPPPR